MACIVYQVNKKTNTKYAYRSESYRDPITKQPRSRRTYLGRVDPETNEIIPKAEKGKRNRKRSTTGNKHSNSKATANASELADNEELIAKINQLSEIQSALCDRLADMDEAISEIRSLASRL